MPEGKIIPYSTGEYPELDGMKEGSAVDFQGTARIVKTQGTSEGGEGEGSMGLQIDQIELTPSDNEATNEWNKMAGKQASTPPDEMKMSAKTNGF